MKLRDGEVRRIFGVRVLREDEVRRLGSQQAGFRVSPLFWRGSRVLGERIGASGGEFAETGISSAYAGSDRTALFSNFAGEEQVLLLPLHCLFRYIIRVQPTRLVVPSLVIFRKRF